MRPQRAAPPPGLDPLAGPRKAALLLHAMASETRLWLLEQLPAAQADALRALLAELNELGIPADQTLLREVLADPDLSEPRAEAAPDAEAQLAAIEKAGPGSLWLALREEPAGLIARLLALFDLQWERAFLDQLGPAKRHQVQSLLSRFRTEQQGRSAPPEQLRAVLLALVAEKLSTFQTSWMLDQTLAAERGRRTRRWWRRPASTEATP
jgi:hypothetical protein